MKAMSSAGFLAACLMATGVAHSQTYTVNAPLSLGGDLAGTFSVDAAGDLTGVSLAVVNSPPFTGSAFNSVATAYYQKTAPGIWDLYYSNGTEQVNISFDAPNNSSAPTWSSFTSEAIVNAGVGVSFISGSPTTATDVIEGGSITQGSAMSAPELNSSSGAGALTLLGGVLVLINGRRYARTDVKRLGTA